VPTTVLCPYDARGLAAAVLDDARRTHPRLVEGGARRASPDYRGTSSSRAQDLVTAVHEIAANTVVHATGTGTLTTWRDGTAVCEIRDEGRITDPLAGRHPGSPHQDSGTACAWPTSCATWSSCDPGPGAPPPGCTSSSADGTEPCRGNGWGIRAGGRSRVAGRAA
jgi:hypothetical protein